MPFQQVISAIKQEPVNLKALTWPNAQTNPIIINVVAPHPDDFDAIALTLHYFKQHSYRINLFVLSGGSKGVQDQFLGTDDWEEKARIRELEQLASARLFGLQDNNISFLRLIEAEDGELDDSESNYDKLKQHLVTKAPSIWCLPYGSDTNTAHQRTYSMAKRIAQASSQPVLLLCNKDAKTLNFSTHLYLEFGSEEAEWKAKLLRCHESQQARNLNLRGYGFDERVLRFNQEVAKQLNILQSHAEAFHLELIK